MSHKINLALTRTSLRQKKTIVNMVSAPRVEQSLQEKINFKGSKNEIQNKKEDISVEFKCEICKEKTFCSKNNLNKHIRDKHPEIVKCKICDVEVGDLSIEEHMEKIHKVKLNTVTLHFDNEIDFTLWKRNEEKMTNSLYISPSGTKRTSKCIAKRYFLCQKSGKFVSKVPENQRCHQKRRTSVRCGTRCPARMTLTVDRDGHYMVEYQSAHFGHSSQSSNSTLSETVTSDKTFLQWILALQKHAKWRDFGDDVHMQFVKDQDVVMINQIQLISTQGMLRPCFAVSILIQSDMSMKVYIRGVEFLINLIDGSENKMPTEDSFFKILTEILNGPKCPGAMDYDALPDNNLPSYLDACNTWRHESCAILSDQPNICDACLKLKVRILRQLGHTEETQ